VHVAGYNLGLIMRLLAGTPREFLARASAHLLVLASADGAALVILVVTQGCSVLIGGRGGALAARAAPVARGGG
jgi:hypothetical protein